MKKLIEIFNEKTVKEYTTEMYNACQKTIECVILLINYKIIDCDSLCKWEEAL